MLGRALALVCALFLVATPASSPTAEALTGTAPARLWEPPLGHPLRLAAVYSLADGPYRAGHRGVDLPAETGEAVRAPEEGTVSFSGVVVDRPVLSIRLDARTVVSFEPVTSPLSKGDPVMRGERIAQVASGGHCGTACLHLGLRVDGEYANPLRFLRPRPVLLPW